MLALALEPVEGAVTSGEDTNYAVVNEPHVHHLPTPAVDEDVALASECGCVSWCVLLYQSQQLELFPSFLDG